MPTFSISARIAKLAMGFVHRGQYGGPALQGIQIEAKPDRPGVYVVGTDGHRVGVFDDPDGTVTGGPVLVSVPAEMLRRIKGRDRMAVCFDGNRLSLVQPFGQCELWGCDRPYVLTDHTYPEWRRYLPCPGHSEMAIALDPVKLEPFKAVARWDAGQGALSLGFSHAGGPVLVTVDTAPDFYGAIMPLRRPSPVRPEWLERKTA